MPGLTRWFIRLSLIYLIASLLIGFLLVAGPALNLPGGLSSLNPVYFHLFMVGWLSQLIFGVVFWMFPKLSTQKPRGDERLGWITLVLLNLGLVLRAFTEPLNLLAPSPIWGGGLVISALFQWIAGMCFVINTWSRVKEK